MPTQPQDLRLRTKKFALRVMRLCDAIPQRTSGRAIAKQLVRSGTSVGANYRAAGRARSRAEFIAKLGIVVEEIDETQYWLDLLAESGLLKPEQTAAIIGEAAELTAIFTAARQTAKNGRAKGAAASGTLPD